MYFLQWLAAHCTLLHLSCRDLVKEYGEKKAAGVFEVRRPKTTKEIAIHNNQLLQQLPGQIQQALLQAQRGEEPAWWCQAMQQQPGAPRPTPEEQEQMAEQQREQLLRKAQALEESGVGESPVLR